MPPTVPPGTLAERLQCLLGLSVFVAAAWLIGRWRTRGQARTPFPWRVVGWGIGLQFAFAVLVLKTPDLMLYVTRAIDALLGYTRDGARMVFGNLFENAVPVTPDADGKLPASAGTPGPARCSRSSSSRRSSSFPA